jgi:hypothetical protein
VEPIRRKRKKGPQSMKGMKEENEKREAKNENILYNEDPNLKSKQRKKQK